MTSASHSIGTHGLPYQVKENGSACGIARWSRIHWPVAMCQLTSPSLKIVVELPSAAGISSTAMNSGRIDGALRASARASAISPARSSGACPFRGAAAADGVEDEADHLRGKEEQLCAARQAVEEVETAKDAAQADNPRQRCLERAFGVRLATAQHEHRGADRDERGERAGVGEGRDARKGNEAGKDRGHDRGEDSDPNGRAALPHPRKAARHKTVAGDG